MKDSLHPVTPHRDISPATQTTILLILAAAWLLFCFSSGEIRALSWYPYLLSSRIALCVIAIATACLFFKRPSWLVITRYMLLCLLVQSIFGAIEPATSLEFYQYCAYFLFIASWSFSGTFKDWITKYFPFAFLGLAIPIFFKDHSLFYSVGKFVYEFTTTVVMIFLSFAAVFSSSKRYQILMQNIGLREQLLEAERLRKEEVEKEVESLKAQIEKDARSRAYVQIAEHVFHDLRSPLAMIKTAVKLADEELSGKYSQFIHLGIERMESIVSDLAQKGKLKIETVQPDQAFAESSLTEIVESVVNEKKILHGSRAGLEIDFVSLNFPTNTQFKIVEAEFKRALSNILNNSIEAITGQGRVSVTLRQIENDAEVTIADSGSGIPAEVLPKLMTRGFTFGKQNGSGFGLYYAKTTLEKWGGSLILRSTAGEGTTVIMRVPAHSL